MGATQLVKASFNADFRRCYGTEFTSNAILARSKDHSVESHGITPGSRCKTLMSRASTAGCGTRWSTKACSSAAIMPEAPLLGRRLQPLPAALIARTRPGHVMQIPLPQPAPTLREMKASRFRHLAYSERAGSRCELSGGCPFKADLGDWSYHTSSRKDRRE